MGLSCIDCGAEVKRIGSDLYECVKGCALQHYADVCNEATRSTSDQKRRTIEAELVRIGALDPHCKHGYSVLTTDSGEQRHLYAGTVCK